MTVIYTTSLIVFACKDKSCAPPPVGTGGSRPTGSGMRADSAKKAIRMGTKARSKRLDALDKISISAYSDDDAADMDSINNLDRYTEEGYEQINHELRHPGWKGQEPSDRVKAIDRAFEEFGVELTEPVTLLRGIPMPDLVPDEGAEFSDRAFVSTTANTSIAERFASGFSRRTGAIIRINVPAGRTVLAGRPTEDELILPRNSRFRVRSKRQAAGLGKPVEIEIDLL
jgi:hypothetical protein